MSKLSESLKKLSSKLEDSINDSLDNLALLAQQHAKSTNLFEGNSPNGLRNNIIIKSGSYSRTILANKWYADYIENGNNRGPNGNWIYPKKAKCLHFFWKGKEFFLKRVKAHAALPFMKEAKEYTEKKAISIIEKELAKLLKEI